MRPRRHVRRPPDLTSLFDVLFIVVFAALIRAAAVEKAAQTPAPPARPSAPVTPPAVAALRQSALAQLSAELAGRTPLVVRIAATTKGATHATIEALELDGKRIALDAPLLEHSPDPDVVVSYLGDRSAELRVCRIAALHLGVAELSRYLVIIAPVIALDDLPEALFGGLHRDLDRCLTEQHGIAVLVDPTALTPPRGTP